MSSLVDLTGQRYGMLTVIGRGEDYITPKGRRVVRWRCRCDCGNLKDISASHLRDGNNVSCGCYHRKRLIEAGRENSTRHNMSRTRLYKEYIGMKSRCYLATNPSYANYGGRGIGVCEEWRAKNGFEAFRDWAIENGYRDDLTLDRIDVNGNYGPENCRWVDWETQYNNTTKSVKITYNGKTQTAAQWAREIGVDRHTVYSRIKSGKSIEEIVGPRMRRKSG